MKIFSREIHLFTRGSAALFALYILSTTDDTIMRIGAIIMLIFDVYTFMKTLY